MPGYNPDGGETVVDRVSGVGDAIWNNPDFLLESQRWGGREKESYELMARRRRREREGR